MEFTDNNCMFFHQAPGLSTGRDQEDVPERPTESMRIRELIDIHATQAYTNYSLHMVIVPLI
jgi:hypothetical protein